MLPTACETVPLSAADPADPFISRGTTRTISWAPRTTLVLTLPNSIRSIPWLRAPTTKAHTRAAAK